jgi:hypothetical protein
MADRLAPELILDILEYFIRRDIATETQSFRISLLSCARLCRQWSPVAQHLLFRHVLLNRYEQALAFQHAVDTSTTRGKNLASSVHTLEIEVYDPAEHLLGPVNQSQLADILATCSPVHTLRLQYYSDQVLESSTLELLRSVPAPEALVLRASKKVFPLRELIELWPSITFLDILTWGYYLDETRFIGEHAPSSWAPYEARFLDQINVEEARLTTLLVSPSLRILEIMETPSWGVFRDICIRHGPSLRSLRLHYINDDHAASLKYFNALEEFKLHQIPSPIALANLPRSLQHLQFQNGIRKHHSIEHVIDFVRSHPAIHAVTYNLCGPRDSLELVELRRLCLENNIQLRCFADGTPNIEVSVSFLRPRCLVRLTHLYISG